MKLDKKKLYRIKLAEQHRNTEMRKDHAAAMLIRKMDANAARIKDHNAKNPTNKQAVPKTGLHKITI